MARPVTISVSKLKKSSRWSLLSLKQHDLRLSITLRWTSWTAIGEGYRQTTASWLKIANEKEIECDFSTITEVELGNVFDKCTWIFVKRMTMCAREAVRLLGLATLPSHAGLCID